MKIISGFENRKVRLEMLPLIDVIFLLLVFFIYAMLSMSIHHGINVDLPDAFTAVIDNRDNITISITDDNRLFVNKIETTIEEMVEQIKRQSVHEDISILINGDKKADLGIAVKVLDRLRGVGINEVSFECVVEKP